MGVRGWRVRWLDAGQSWTAGVLTCLPITETRDGRKSYDAGPHSPEMKRLNKKFGMLHGLSSLTNLAALFAQFYYGVVLAQRM